MALLRFDPEGRLHQLDPSLQARQYTVDGDSLRISGGDHGIFGTSSLFFRLSGDSLWVGEDDLPEVRVGVAPADAVDSLTGRWGYERHGERFERTFTPDRRIVFSIVQEGSYAWRGDTLVLSMDGRHRSTLAEIRGELLTLTELDGERRRARFVRVAGIPEDVRSTLLVPSPAVCSAVRRETRRLIEGGKIFTYEDGEDGVWGDIHHATGEVHLLKSIIGSGRISALTMGHLAAHALGHGVAPESEWATEQIVRSCIE